MRSRLYAARLLNADCSECAAFPLVQRPVRLQMQTPQLLAQSVISASTRQQAKTKSCGENYGPASSPVGTRFVKL